MSGNHVRLGQPPQAARTEGPPERGQADAAIARSASTRPGRSTRSMGDVAGQGQDSQERPGVDGDPGPTWGVEREVGSGEGGHRQGPDRDGGQGHGAADDPSPALSSARQRVPAEQAVQRDADRATAHTVPEDRQQVEGRLNRMAENNSGARASHRHPRRPPELRSCSAHPSRAPTPMPGTKIKPKVPDHSTPDVGPAIWAMNPRSWPPTASGPAPAWPVGWRGPHRPRFDTGQHPRPGRTVGGGRWPGGRCRRNPAAGGGGGSGEPGRVGGRHRRRGDAGPPEPRQGSGRARGLGPRSRVQPATGTATSTATRIGARATTVRTRLPRIGLSAGAMAGTQRPADRPDLGEHAAAVGQDPDPAARTSPAGPGPGHGQPQPPGQQEQLDVEGEPSDPGPANSWWAAWR